MVGTYTLRDYQEAKRQELALSEDETKEKDMREEEPEEDVYKRQVAASSDMPSHYYRFTGSLACDSSTAPIEKKAAQTAPESSGKINAGT